MGLRVRRAIQRLARSLGVLAIRARFGNDRMILPSGRNRFRSLARMETLLEGPGR